MLQEELIIILEKKSYYVYSSFERLFRVLNSKISSHQTFE